MRRFLAILCASLALSWCAPAAAAIGTPNSIGSANTGASTANTLTLPTTADAPAATELIGVINSPTAATTMAVADSKNNAYSVTARFVGSTCCALWMFHVDNPADLPAPCTVTATETATTLVITALGTCPSSASLGNGTVITETISGGSFTGSFATSTPCLLSSLPVTCTITGGATIGAGATATLTSTINATWNGTAGRAGMGAVTVTGLRTSGALDVTGAGSTAGSPGTSSSIATGTLAQAEEIVFGRVDTSQSTGTFTQASGFSALPTITIGGGNAVTTWGYQIVASTTTVTYAPSWITSRTFGTNVYSFKAPAAAGGPCLLGLLGVGKC